MGTDDCRTPTYTQSRIPTLRLDFHSSSQMTTVLVFENIDVGVYAGLVSGAIALVTMFVLLFSLLASPKKVDNSPKMEKMVKVRKCGTGQFCAVQILTVFLHFQIADSIQEGAKAFLAREYMYISLFVILVFVLICASPYLEENADHDKGWKTGVNFLVGSTLSALAGWVGMYTATNANVR
jgi:magnesium-transporting ATPase (P-type)